MSKLADLSPQPNKARVQTQHDTQVHTLLQSGLQEQKRLTFSLQKTHVCYLERLKLTATVQGD